MGNLIQPDDGRGGVDGVDDVVERAGERVDVLAIERRDEGLVQALNHLVRQVVAAMLDFLDFVRLVQSGASGASISSSSCDPRWICSAIVTKSSKNFSSLGSSLNATSPPRRC